MLDLLHRFANQPIDWYYLETIILMLRPNTSAFEEFPFHKLGSRVLSRLETLPLPPALTPKPLPENWEIVTQPYQRLRIAETLMHSSVPVTMKLRYWFTHAHMQIAFSNDVYEWLRVPFSKEATTLRFSSFCQIIPVLSSEDLPVMKYYLATEEDERLFWCLYTLHQASQYRDLDTFKALESCWSELPVLEWIESRKWKILRYYPEEWSLYPKYAHNLLQWYHSDTDNCAWLETFSLELSCCDSWNQLNHHRIWYHALDLDCVSFYQQHNLPLPDIVVRRLYNLPVHSLRNITPTDLLYKHRRHGHSNVYLTTCLVITLERSDNPKLVPVFSKLLLRWYLQEPWISQLDDLTLRQLIRITE